jgi:hypothetical protein
VLTALIMAAVVSSKGFLPRPSDDLSGMPFADTAGHFRLAWVFGRKGTDVGLNVPVVAAIGGGGPPGMEKQAGGVAIQFREDSPGFRLRPAYASL